MVGNYISEMGRPKIPTKSIINVHNLLTHSSGFDERNLGIAALSAETMEPLEKFLKSFPPRIREPYKAMTYSNHGMTLLGYLGALVNRKDFSQCLQDEIFNPLQMANSFASYDVIPSAVREKWFVNPAWRTQNGRGCTCRWMRHEFGGEWQDHVEDAVQEAVLPGVGR